MTKILLVEDDAAALECMAALLRGHGYTVGCATSGEEALQCIAADCPEAVISDLVMPGMDGNTLLREVRKLAPECPVTFIVLTGQPTVTTVVDAVTDGADEVLLKPVDIDRLLAILGAPQAPRAQVAT
jgi:two-component system, NtrC family, response regulator GlrR